VGSINSIEVQADLDVKEDSISKITRTKSPGGVAPVVECLSSKHEESLSSNPSTAKKRKKKQNKKPKWMASKDKLFPSLIFFEWDWSLNSRLSTCKAGTLPLEPHLQYILLCLFWKWRVS
jgi:hypothetical protein